MHGCRDACLALTVGVGMPPSLEWARSRTMGGNELGRLLRAGRDVREGWRENGWQAMRNEIHHYGDGVMACVMDSYDYDNALDKVLPK